MSLDWLEEELAALDTRSLLRRRRAPFAAAGATVSDGAGRSWLNLASNDYLGLASTTVGGEGAGSSASPLVCGRHAVHAALEDALADWLHVEAVLLFPSGFAANLATVAALSTADSMVISDALNHASLVDGCRLGRGRVVRVPHGDLEAVERALTLAPERRRLVVTDAYFSMDGDVPPLRALREICDRFDAALLADEAHALGVFGDQGRGACAEAGVAPDILVGTFGKSFGAGGAFVAGSRSLIDWLWNRARAVVFSTGLSPALAGAALRALPIVADGARTAVLHERVAAFREALAARQVSVGEKSRGPIVPVVLESPERTREVVRRLDAAGIFAHPMLPPTVPPRTSRLRLTVQAGHAIDELCAAAATIAEVLR